MNQEKPVNPIIAKIREYENEMHMRSLRAGRDRVLARQARSAAAGDVEKRPPKASGFRINRLRDLGTEAARASESYSVWTRRGVWVVSSIEVAASSDGNEGGLHWHVSASTGDGNSPCSDEELRQVRACFGMEKADERPGDAVSARHLWLVVRARDAAP